MLILPWDLGLLRCTKLIFAYTAEGANPIIRQLFELGACWNTVLRITYSGVVLVPAYFTNVLCHNCLFLGVNNNWGI